MILSTSEAFGDTLDFQYCAISILATRRMCVVTTRKSRGKFSIPMLSISRLGFGGVKIPVIFEI